jgi:hypothetical protein
VTGSARRLPPTSAVFALLIVLLAAASQWWPRPEADLGDGTLLAYLPVADVRREDAIAALGQYVGDTIDRTLVPRIARDREEFRAGLDDALVVIAPDGAALALPTAAWQPVVAARRHVPWNLRPSGMLLSRRDVAATEAPWRTAPRRTAIADSLSLVCLAPLCADGSGHQLPRDVAWGDDPLDHAAVLVAAAHGAYDHVVAREWDVEAAVAAGRLDPARWTTRKVSGPMPDVVVLASRRLPAASRLALQQALSTLGRSADGEDARCARLEVHLGQLGLDGFNLLLGPDFDRLRRQFGPCWPELAE